MGIHDGHRERLKARYLENGLEDFNEVNALELLLFYAIPRRDTNELAHKLLDRFGSLYAVFDASVAQLKEIEGIGENAALLISMIPQLYKRGEASRARYVRKITTTAEAAAYLLPLLMYEKDEKALLICLDVRGRILSTTTLNEGVVNSVDLNVRKIVEIALKERATSVVLAHNHPDGVAIPSREDELTTRKILSALELVNIKLIDHIIVARNDYASFADSRMLWPF